MNHYTIFLTEQHHDYCTTQVNLPPDVAEIIRAASFDIQYADIVSHEDQPHITIKYGLHSINAENVRGLLRHTKHISVTLGQLSLFELPDYDVLKFDVSSADLHHLNHVLSTLPHTDDFPDYHPHVTVAYLRTGTGHKYTDIPSLRALSGDILTFWEIQFSNQEGEKTLISLS